MPPDLSDVIRTLRGRIVRALETGALKPGDRLPGGRHIWVELGSSARVINAAYRALEAEGLVELRDRSGVYVAYRPSGRAGIHALPEEMLVDLLARGLSHGVPITELHDSIRRSVDTAPVRLLVVAPTQDQIMGLCRELKDDYGIEASGIEGRTLRDGPVPRSCLRGVGLLVTTVADAPFVERLAEELRIPVLVAEIRPDLLRGEWGLLLREPVYVVATDLRFVELLQRFFAGAPGAHNLRALIVGRDDILAIPPDATTYITRSARDRLGAAAVIGRALPPIRLLSNKTAREIITFVVRANRAATAKGP